MALKQDFNSGIIQIFLFEIAYFATNNVSMQRGPCFKKYLALEHILAYAF